MAATDTTLSPGNGTSASPDDATPVERVLQSSGTFLDRQADALTTLLADRVTKVATDLRSVGHELSGTETTAPTAALAEQGAQHIERVAGYLRAADGESLIADAEHFAARNPIAATGVALLLGMMVSRFFKLSSATRRSSYDG